MQATGKNKLKKGNLNKKDYARNMRGIRKYKDKINFIVANNIKIKPIENRDVLDNIKGDKEFAKIKEEKRSLRAFGQKDKNNNKLDLNIKKNDNSEIEIKDEYQKNNLDFDESVFDEENQKGESNTFLKDKASSYIPKKLEETDKFNFNILYEDERIMIIDKWAGIMVHPDEKNDEVTLSDIVYNKYEYMREVGEGDRFGIVHRLDRNTTGALVLCKTKDSHKDMKNLFKEHKVRKIYRAIVEGNVREDTGIIDFPIARARSDFRKKTIVDMFSKDFRGEERSAITKYKVLARSEDKKFTYVELYPLTGRTHQLRVHMRHIRHPIVGDDLYGSRVGADLAPRSMLHAFKIEFTLRKKEIKATSPVPQDMQAVVEKYFGAQK